MARHDEIRAVYVISVAAELAGVHPQTLRIYERKGLLEPARTNGGNRRYSDADLRRLQRIHDLMEEGLNLAGVAKILELESRVDVPEREVDSLRSQAQNADAEAARRVRCVSRTSGRATSTTTNSTHFAESLRSWCTNWSPTAVDFATVAPTTGNVQRIVHPATESPHFSGWGRGQRGSRRQPA